MFDTKIAIIIRDDLATWQKLNVTAFLMSGITGANPEIVGKAYVGAAGDCAGRPGKRADQYPQPCQ
jgi:hypothetical protein